jgi:glucose/arabinose dehydrogenase
MMPNLAPAALAASLALLLVACSGPAATPTATDPSAGPSARPSASGGPGGPSPIPSSGPGPTGLVVELEPLVAGFEAPLLVTHAGDGSGRLFVVEQGGTVRIVRDGRVLEEPFLDLSRRLTTGGERGLLGLAFHPDFGAGDGRVFVDYTNLTGDTVVAELRVSADDPDRVDPGSHRELIGVDQPFANHNGGHLAFGPDGYLYVGLGDGGAGGDPLGAGQRLDTHLGKLLRIGVDPADGRPYTIPADNPYVGVDGALPEIWLSGVRNPWRFAFDRATGDLWVADVGQGDLEEIDRLPASAGGGRGADLGWNVMEGSRCYGGGSGCADPSFTLPIAEYGHDVGCSVTGGHVYRGVAQPRLAGLYLFADYCSGRVWAVEAAGPATQVPWLAAETGRTISSFGEDEAGELYVTDHASGAVLRIVARGDAGG